MSKSANTSNGGNKSVKHILAFVTISFAIVCWSGAYVASRFLLHPSQPGLLALSPLLLATARFSIASLFFVAPLIQALVRRDVSARDLLFLVALGQISFSLYYWLQYIGIQETSASISALLGVGLIPLFTALLAHVFGAEHLRGLAFFALVLGLLGVALVVLQPPLSFTLHAGFFLGALCLICNTFLFALYTNLSKRWLRTMSPLVLTSGTMISGTCGLLLLSLFVPERKQWSIFLMLNGTQWAALLFLAVVCSVLAYFAYNAALRQMDASRVSSYFYIEPCLSIIFAILLLGEQLTWQLVAGALVIGGSIFLLHRTRSAPVSPEDRS